jgi:hypothetical protein
MLKTMTAAGLGLVLLAGPAVAQNPTGGAIVAAQLDAASNEMGLTPGARVTGRLAQGGRQMTNIQAPRGTTYFIGVCDENCRDLDLIVRDASGREVDRDEETDDVPIVAVETRAGTYTVEVSMAACTGQCHWGVGVFR